MKLPKRWRKTIIAAEVFAVVAALGVMTSGLQWPGSDPRRTELIEKLVERTRVYCKDNFGFTLGRGSTSQVSKKLDRVSTPALQTLNDHKFIICIDRRINKITKQWYPAKAWGKMYKSPVHGILYNTTQGPVLTFKDAKVLPHYHASAIEQIAAWLKEGKTYLLRSGTLYLSVKAENGIVPEVWTYQVPASIPKNSPLHLPPVKI